MKLINLGCGSIYHKEWINYDFISDSKYVISHNLLNGIPLDNSSVDAVYHSHILEHFTKDDGIFFIQECYRVLQPNGILRIAVPDLEVIAKEYLRNLERSINNEPEAEFDYDWILLEMYDQTVRNTSGGDMAKFLFRKVIPNREYVFNRIGCEGEKIYEAYINSTNAPIKKSPALKHLIDNFEQLLRRIIENILSMKANNKFNKIRKAVKIGKFRLSGEIHLNMYDRYSLERLLKSCGFQNINVTSAFKSEIFDWNKYELDSIDGIVRKPDSLFMEAHK